MFVIGLYDRKVTQIEAFKWTGRVEDFADASAFCKPTVAGSNGPNMYLYAKSGVQLVVPGDFIVKEVDGSGVYAIEPHIFYKLYQPALDHAEMRA